MQEVAAQRLGGSAIEPVPDDRVTDGGKVHADLVCTASPDQHFKQCELVEAPQDAVFAPGMATVRQPGSHANSRVWIAGDRLVNASVIGFDHAMHQGEIDLTDAASGELCGE